MFPTKGIFVDHFLLITELNLVIIKPVISKCFVQQLVKNKTNNYLDIELHIERDMITQIIHRNLKMTTTGSQNGSKLDGFQKDIGLILNLENERKAFSSLLPKTISDITETFGRNKISKSQFNVAIIGKIQL